MSSKLSLTLFILIWLAYVLFAGSYYFNTFTLFTR